MILKSPTHSNFPVNSRVLDAFNNNNVATYIAHRSTKLALMALYIIYEHREGEKKKIKKKKKKSEKWSGPFFSLLKT